MAINSQEECIGLKRGDVFVELMNSQAAVKVLRYFQEIKNEKVRLEVVCVPVEAYVGYFLTKLQGSKV